MPFSALNLYSTSIGSTLALAVCNSGIFIGRICMLFLDSPEKLMENYYCGKTFLGRPQHISQFLWHIPSIKVNSRKSLADNWIVVLVMAYYLHRCSMSGVHACRVGQGVHNHVSASLIKRSPPSVSNHWLSQESFILGEKKYGRLLIPSFLTLA